MQPIMTGSDHHFSLPTGDLTLHVATPGVQHLDSYLHVAARRNPKRGFLFVSHLLGKHVPTPLGRLRKAHDRLARPLLDTLMHTPGPVLVVGMAETATLLGYGVWRTLASLMREHAPSRPVYFLQTTRYPAAGHTWSFEESHSHAPQQWLQGLDDPRLANVQHVVLVDDELSTGNTFVALEQVLRTQWPRLDSVQWACLTDFRPDAYRQHPATSLLQGHWAFTPRGDVTPVITPSSQPVDPAVLRCDFGRAAPLDWAQRKTTLAAVRHWLDGVEAHGRVLMLGTGEFMPVPFELGELLEDHPRVESVDFQATTRSPALMPGVALGPDHYGEGIPQFLYHHDRSAYDSVIVAVETPRSTVTDTLAQRLQAQLVGPFQTTGS